MYQGIIFDLDGTLWDSTLQILPAWNIVLQRYNIEHRLSHQGYQRLYGKDGCTNCTKRILPDEPLEQKSPNCKGLLPGRIDISAKERRHAVSASGKTLSHSGRAARFVYRQQLPGRLYRNFFSERPQVQSLFLRIFNGRAATANRKVKTSEIS